MSLETWEDWKAFLRTCRSLYSCDSLTLEKAPFLRDEERKRIRTDLHDFKAGGLGVVFAARQPGNAAYSMTIGRRVP